MSAGNSTEALNQDTDFEHRRLKHNISDSVIPNREQKPAKKRKPERVRGPHKSRENLGRPTILDVDMKQQPVEGEYHSCFEHSYLCITAGEDVVDNVVDFSSMPVVTRLSTKAAHDKCEAAKNIKRRRATTKRSLFLHTDQDDTSIVDPSAIAVS